MARKIETYEKQILESIEKNNIYTIEMIFAFYTGISRGHFYDIKLNKSDTIKKALDDNKNRTKHSLLDKWFKSDNPTLQIALFKTICSEEEAHRLNGTKQQFKQEDITIKIEHSDKETQKLIDEL